MAKKQNRKKAEIARETRKIAVETVCRILKPLGKDEARRILAAVKSILQVEKPYTQAEFRRFKRLVELAESRSQQDRIRARLEQPKFIAEVGREKCDLMFKVLCGKT